MGKKTKKTLTISLLMIMILCLSVTTAYFAVSVSNTNNEKINTTSSKLSIVYTDCASSKQSDCANMTKNLGLGESFEKTFKVYNNGTLPVDYKIIFKELTNTFQNNDLVYTIKDLNDNVLQSERPVPYASSQTTNVNVYLDTIAANTTKEFKIIVKLKETTEDQTVNASATYSIKLGLTTQNGGTDKLYNLIADADPNTVDVITKTAPTGEVCTNTLAYDNTVDNNLRYVGPNPCNYVSFNNELWRIIGIMNNVDDGTGKKETRFKLIRNEILGYYSYDTRETGSGVNDWTTSKLMIELNGDYLDTTLSENQNWYNGQYNQQTGVYDYTKGLKQEAQNFISNAVWYLGARGDASSDPPTNAYYFYEAERGTATPVSGRETTWTGKVALIYPSDFAFATSGGTNLTRSECINANISYGSSSWYSSYNSCPPKDWLKIIAGNSYYWLLNPDVRKTYIQSVAIINDSYQGYINNYNGTYYPYYNKAVFPTLYLKSNIEISGGNGSINSPYILK